MRMPFGVVGFGLVLLALVGGRPAQAASDAATNAPVLRLTTGDVDPTTRPNLLESPGAIAADQAYVLQLSGPLTGEIEAALARLGVSRGGYLPEWASIVTLDAAAGKELANMPEARWLGAYEPDWKISPVIGQREYYTDPRRHLADLGLVAVDITCFAVLDLSTADVEAELSLVPSLHITHMRSVGGQHIVTATADPRELPRLAELRCVQYVEETPDVRYRNDTVRWIVQTNVADLTPLYDAGLTGAGQIAGLMDAPPDVTHCSFSDPSENIGPQHRKFVAYNTVLGTDFHGTHVAGTLAGDGGSFDDTRGVAFNARIAFNLDPLFTSASMFEQLELHHEQGARVHSNSWGDDTTDTYNMLARDVDRYMHNHEDGLVLFATSNSEVLRNPENAKNLIAVGASLDTPDQDSFCSGGEGPTSDGRRKPEIMAPGCSILSSSWASSCGVVALSGTSMACPAVSGAALLAREYFEDGYYPTGAPQAGAGFTPSGALLKAVLLNAAVDMTGIPEYPSTSEGWGRLRLADALYLPGDTRRLVVDDRLNADGLSTGEEVACAIDVLSNDAPLKVTLAWTDPPATAGAANAAINNLDLEVVSPGGDIYLGNVFGSGVSTLGGTADPVNNLEQVHVADPSPGAWTVRIAGSAINDGPQGFGLAITGDLAAPQIPFTLRLLDDPPTQFAPNAPATFDVEIIPQGEAIAAAELLTSVEDGPLTAAPLTPLGEHQYRATLDPAACFSTVTYHVRVIGDGGSVRTIPQIDFADAFVARVGESIQRVNDTMETDLGWTVGSPTDTALSGIWERVDPVGTSVEPGTDHTPDGVLCWLTGQHPGGGAGANDVDGGTTTLTSPAYDVSDLNQPTLRYWRWYSNSSGASPNEDVFRVQISVDDGPWTALETVGPGGSGTTGGWRLAEFDLADALTGASTLRVRFIAADEGSGSLVEAAIDDLEITGFDCQDVAPCPADLNGDGLRDHLDLGILLAAYLVSDGGDINGDGITNNEDLGMLLAGYLTPCP